uniref:RING-H2 finger protein ATL2G n=1 Tax=Cajanus cajan TaxID=3821 RepID=A0A151QTV8_CAJCA|nr:RING-H2 finger protein ATL2G [Cajanus cajan]
MGSNGSKATSSCSSSSSSSGSLRKGRSKGLRVFQSYCLGTTSGSHDSKNDDQVCDHNKANGTAVTYTDGNGTDSVEVKTESFRKVNAGEMTFMPSNVDLHEWGETSIHNTSRTGSSSIHSSSTHSLNPTSHFLSRFCLIPGNVSFGLSRTTSLGSSRPCPVSSASLSIFGNEDEHNLHPVPGNLQSSSTGGICTSEGPGVNLFSPRTQIDTENVDTRHIDQQNGARESVEQNVRFSRTLSVGRLHDRVLRPSTLSELRPLQQERELVDVNLPRQDIERQAVEGDSRVSPSNHSAVNSSSISGYPPSSMSNSLFGIQDYEVEASRLRDGRYQNLLEHRSNFLERRRRIRSQVRALQRLGSRFENISGHDRSCILSGQNRNGRCTCRINNGDTSNDDTGARASISRIVMLAEALFEVLDEIHQQSVVLSSRPSVSSIGSVPAPNDVVESLPVKLYEKLHKHQEDGAQCYICLVEYEDGDNMRVLPCHHEFHRTCIDKWLKEIHRVCPLCRGDICISDSTPTQNSSG